MATITTQVTKGRFGFHPCDYEQFLAIKKAHALLLRAYKDVKKWIAWTNKTVYRTGPEPIHPVLLVEQGLHTAGKKCWSGYGFKRSKGTNLYHKILHAYQHARRPQPSPDLVLPLDLPEDLGVILTYLEAFYASKN